MSLKVLVVGASRGIGLELARQYAAAGAKVVATCRGRSEALEALDKVHVIENVDVVKPATLSAMVDKLVADNIVLDVVVCNAGMLAVDGLGSELNIDTVMQQIQVNAVGLLSVVNALKIGDRVSEGGKIALITSEMGSIAGNGSGGMYGYRMSKAALNAAGVSMARDLAKSGIAVALLHPGYVDTDMTKQFQGNKVSPEESATGLRKRIEELTLETSGSFFTFRGDTLPW